MNREDLVNLIPIERIEEEGVVSFFAQCPERECKHDDESVVHYGNEAEARLATIGKIMNHLRLDHGIVPDDAE
jgi:hypothetical protein